MKISDVAMGKAVLENLADKKRSQKLGNVAENLKRNLLSDSFQANKTVPQDVAKINDLQKSFMKDQVSLNGLNQLKGKIEKFEHTAIDSRDYELLSRELNAIVSSTKFDGESVISYLSTQVKDEKTLYTFKNNLMNEISGTQTKVAEERKSIASYLVKGENMEVAGDFSSEKTVDKILSSLNKKNMDSIFKGISNLNTLLGIEK